MAAGFDDFLDDLREQVQRCAAAEVEAGAATARERRTPSRLRPRRVRVLVGWAAAALVVATAVAVTTVATRPAPGPSASPAANGVLPGSSAFAYVQPRVTPTPGATAPVSPTPAAPAAVDYVLWSVSARAVNDAWAVGSRSAAGSGERGQSFALHWDGAVWREVPVPDVGVLTAVTVARDGQVWALGGSGTSLVRWDGTAWSIQPTGAPAGGTITALAALASNDVWAVGRQPAGALIEHWNGVAWQSVSPPVDTPPSASLNAISAESANDVWAVGGGADRAVALRWDGGRWTLVPGPPSPDEGETGTTALWAVAAVSPADVWASGGGLWSWDGTRWQRSDDESAADVNGPLSASSSSDVWLAAGTTGAAHFDGSGWQMVAADAMGVPPGSSVVVRSVDAVSPADVWLVGDIETTPGSPPQPLVVHWNGSAWRVVVDSVRVP